MNRSCGCMRASTVRCRVLDRCGDSLGVEISFKDICILAAVSNSRCRMPLWGTVLIGNCCSLPTHGACTTIDVPQQIKHLSHSRCRSPQLLLPWLSPVLSPRLYTPSWNSGAAARPQIAARPCSGEGLHATREPAPFAVCSGQGRPRRGWRS